MRWVTETRPHVDRCASAWFIRRYVDDRPTFLFVAPGGEPPRGATPFDLPGARFGHRGGRVTFDALLAAHPQRSPGVRRLAEVVRDIDLGSFRRPESRGLDSLLYGLLLVEPDDRRVLRTTAPWFDGLVRLFNDEAKA